MHNVQSTECARKNVHDVGKMTFNQVKSQKISTVVTNKMSCDWNVFRWRASGMFLKWLDEYACNFLIYSRLDHATEFLKELHNKYSEVDAKF